MSAEESNVLEALPLWPLVLYELGKITVILVQQQYKKIAETNFHGQVSYGD